MRPTNELAESYFSQLASRKWAPFGADNTQLNEGTNPNRMRFDIEIPIFSSHVEPFNACLVLSAPSKFAAMVT